MAAALLIYAQDVIANRMAVRSNHVTSSRRRCLDLAASHDDQQVAGSASRSPSLVAWLAEPNVCGALQPPDPRGGSAATCLGTGTLHLGRDRWRRDDFGGRLWAGLW